MIICCIIITMIMTHLVAQGEHGYRSPSQSLCVIVFAWFSLFMVFVDVFCCLILYAVLQWTRQPGTCHIGSCIMRHVVIYTACYSSNVMYMYIHTYAHTHIRTYNSHTHKRTYAHTYLRTYIHKYIRTYAHTHIRTYVHTYIHTYLHTYIPTYLHTYMRMCIYITYIYHTYVTYYA